MKKRLNILGSFLLRYTIKIPLDFLGWCIYHSTSKYLQVSIPCPDLFHTEYYLYRIDRIFGIRYRMFIDRTTNLGNQCKKRANWYYNYNDITEIIYN